MIRTRLVGLWLGCALSITAATSEETIRSLSTQLQKHVEAPRFARSMWGIKVVSLETGRVWYDWNGGKLMKPASNAKLYTGALALDRFGPTHHVKTTLYRDGPLSSSGTLIGNLIVYGRGDPSFAARFNEGDTRASLNPLVHAIKAAGVRRIDGNLIGDESYFRGLPFGHGWTWDDLQYYYGAEVSALTVDDNVVDLTVHPGQRLGDPCRIEPRPAAAYLAFSNRTVTVDASSRSHLEILRAVGDKVVHVSGQVALGGRPVEEAVTVPGPASWFLVLLREALEREGIEVRGELQRVGWLDREIRPVEVEPWVELIEVKGRAMHEVLSKMMKPSQNLYAHLLLLAVGRERQARDPTAALLTTEDAGLLELRRFIREAGIEAGEVLLEEGSGLSRGGLVTPNATVTLLRYMDQHRWGEVFREALPVAGRDGTLRRRLVGTPAEGAVRAKTGTLRFVHALSGYATAGSGERLAFSIMLNNHSSPAGSGSARVELDEIVLKLVGVGAED